MSNIHDKNDKNSTCLKKVNKANILYITYTHTPIYFLYNYFKLIFKINNFYNKIYITQFKYEFEIII